MQKWEYRLEVLEIQHLEDGQATLNGLGDEGWEAVCLLPHRPGSTDPVVQCAALLKRPKK